MARKSSADIDRFLHLYGQLDANDAEDEDSENLKAECLKSALEIPNNASEETLELGDENRVVSEEPGGFSQPDFKVKRSEELGKILGGLRLGNLSQLTGERSYYLSGGIAELEQV